MFMLKTICSGLTDYRRRVAPSLAIAAWLLIAGPRAAVVLAAGAEPATQPSIAASSVYRPAPVQAQADDAPAASHRLYLPAVNKRAGDSCSYDAAPSIFGVQMYGSTGSNSPYYSALVDSGAEWVRVPIAWSDLEPTNRAPAQFNWGSADQAVNAATEDCMALIITLRTAPDWAATFPESRIDKAPLAEFAQFVTAVVERYDGDGLSDAPGSPIVTYWEIYNEPDSSVNTIDYEGWGEYGAEYAQMLAAVYPAVKAANPNASVLMGGLAYDNFYDKGGNFIRSFLDDVLKAGGGAYFDVMNIHAYPLFGPDWIKAIDPTCVATNSCYGPGLLEKVAYVRNKLAGYKLTKPMMVTESGWHSDNAPDQPSSPEYHARYVFELFTESKAADVRNMIYFALADSGNYPYANGLITSDTPPVRKPAFTAYQVAEDWLADAQFKRSLPPSELKAPEMDAYEFYHPTRGHTFYIAWLNPARMGLDLNQDGNPEVADSWESLRLLGATAKVYDIYGKLLETVSDSDGDVRITIGGQPRIIEIVN